MSIVSTSDIITIVRGLIKDLQQSDGRCSFQYVSDNSFKLDKKNVASATIIVYQNGSVLSTDDWGYNSDTNQVTITPVTSGVSLTSEDDILITFSYYESYSDTEIISYIKSNLVRFVKRRYSKRFYMNAYNEVVTDNGTNPTRSEGDLIAIITAIGIDPQNIKIKTNDFTIEAVEKKSKSEQIDDAFNQFMRAFGEPNFIQDEED